MKRTPLKRKTPLRRSGSLNPVSKRRAKTNTKRRAFVKEELDKRRPFIKEYQELMSVYFPESKPEDVGKGKVNLVRALLPKKISRNKEPSHPSTGSWMTPIDTINY